MLRAPTRRFSAYTPSLIVACLPVLPGCAGIAQSPVVAVADAAVLAQAADARTIAAAKRAPVPSPKKIATPDLSRITGITVTGTQALGTFGGVAYERTYGVVSGIVDDLEEPTIVNLKSAPHNADGDYTYTAQYEVVAPAAGAARNQTVLVDAENRGGGIMMSALNGVASGIPSATTYPVGLGSGFLPNHKLSYARVQWQTGIAAGVPATAQGLGLAIVRDFGRMLAGQTAAVKAANGFTPGVYPKRIIAGLSQSAWFLNTLIEEGFNVDPVRAIGVYDAAIAIDGTGNWMAINQHGAAVGAAQVPYPVENGVPLTAPALLKREATDPLYIDVANYTDFYRLRASLSETVAFSQADYRRYDWPSPHAAGPASTLTIATGFPAACNGGIPIALNPIGYTGYLHALVLDTAKQIGDTVAGTKTLPPSATFTLTPAKAGLANFNALAGVALAVPAVDADHMPVGGVRFPDADLPLGEPAPVSLAPVVIDIGGTCGNMGGWVPFTGGQLTARYGTKGNYLAKYAAELKALESTGSFDADDESAAIGTAAAIYDVYAAT